MIQMVKVAKTLARSHGSRLAQTMDVSPKTAIWLRENCHFPRQRDLRPNHIEELAFAMRNGTFGEGHVFLAVYPDDPDHPLHGKMHILNGNHTLEAIKKSGKTVNATVTFQRMESEDKAGELYAKMDIHRPRNMRDAAKARAIEISFPARKEALYAAIGIILAGFTKNWSANVYAKSQDIRLERLLDYEEALVKLLECTKRGHNRQGIVKRSSILAVALATMRHQPKKAAEFWQGLSRDDGLAERDPRNALLRFWDKHKHRGNEDLYVRATMIAWNFFFSGRMMRNIKPSVSEIVLLGTPWDNPDMVTQPKKERKNANHPGTDSPHPDRGSNQRAGRKARRSSGSEHQRDWLTESNYRN